MRPVTVILLLLTTAWTVARCEVPQRSTFEAGLDEAAMRERMAHSDLQPLEGIWYYPEERMTLGIERITSSNAHRREYRIVLLACDYLELLPGTTVGYLERTAVDNKYKLWLYSQRDRVTLLHPMECVATLNAQGTSLTFDPPHWRVKVRVNLARFLPSIFSGVSILPETTGERLPIGFRKVYPHNDRVIDRVRYL